MFLPSLFIVLFFSHVWTVLIFPSAPHFSYPFSESKEKFLFNLRFDLSQRPSASQITISNARKGAEIVPMAEPVILDVVHEGFGRLYSLEDYHDSGSYSEVMTVRENVNEECSCNNVPENCFCCCRPWPPAEEEGLWRGEEILGRSTRENYFSAVFCVLGDVYKGFKIGDWSPLPFSTSMKLVVGGEEIQVVDLVLGKDIHVAASLENLLYNLSFSFEDQDVDFSQEIVYVPMGPDVDFSSSDFQAEVLIVEKELTSETGECGKLSPQPETWLGQPNKCQVPKDTCSGDGNSVEFYKDIDENLLEMGIPGRNLIRPCNDRFPGKLTMLPIGDGAWKMAFSPKVLVDLTLEIDKSLLEFVLVQSANIEYIATEVVGSKEIRVGVVVGFVPLYQKRNFHVIVDGCNDAKIVVFGVENGVVASMNYDNRDIEIEFDLVSTSDIDLEKTKCNITVFIENVQKAKESFWLNPILQEKREVSNDYEEPSDLHLKYIHMVSCSCNMKTLEIGGNFFTYLECILFGFLESEGDVCLVEKIITGLVVLNVLFALLFVSLQFIFTTFLVVLRLKREKKLENRVNYDGFEKIRSIIDVYSVDDSSVIDIEDETSSSDEENRRAKSFKEDQFLGDLLDMQIDNESDRIILSIDERPPLAPNRAAKNPVNKNLLTEDDLAAEIEEGLGEEIIPRSPIEKKNEQNNNDLTGETTHDDVTKCETVETPKTSFEELSESLVEVGRQSIVDEFQEFDHDIREMLKEEEEIELKTLVANKRPPPSLPNSDMLQSMPVRMGKDGIIPLDLSMELDFKSLRLVEDMFGKKSPSSNPGSRHSTLKKSEDPYSGFHSDVENDDTDDENMDFSVKHRKLVKLLGGKNLPPLPPKKVETDDSDEYSSDVHSDEIIKDEEDEDPRPISNEIKMNNSTRSSDDENNDGDDESDNEEMKLPIKKPSKKRVVRDESSSSGEEMRAPSRKVRKKRKKKKKIKKKGKFKRKKVPKIQPFKPSSCESSSSETQEESDSSDEDDDEESIQWKMLSEETLLEMVETKELCYMNVDRSKRVGKEMFNVLASTMPYSIGGKFTLVGYLKKVVDSDWYKFVIQPKLMVMNYYFEEDECEWIKCDEDDERDPMTIPREYRGYNIPSINFLQKTISKRPVKKFCIINGL